MQHLTQFEIEHRIEYLYSKIELNFNILSSKEFSDICNEISALSIKLDSSASNEPLYTLSRGFDNGYHQLNK